MAHPRVATVAILLTLLLAGPLAALPGTPTAAASGSDVNPPVVGNLTLPASVPDGGVLNLTVEVSDEGDLHDVYLRFRREGSEHVLDVRRINFSGFPPGVIAISREWAMDAIPGNYTLEWVYVNDMAGNHRQYAPSELPPGPRTFLYGDPTRPVDDDAPEVRGYFFNGQTFHDGDTLVIDANVSDESNLTYVAFVFRKPGGNDAFDVSLWPSPSTAPGWVQMRHVFHPGQLPVGTYEMYWVETRDVYGNNERYAPPVVAGAPLNFTYLGAAPVRSGPDLVALALNHTPASPRHGQLVNVTATVRNQGDQMSQGADYAFLVDGAIVRTGTFPILAPNDTITLSFNWNATQGTHDLTFYVDASGRINETDETNNVLSRQVTVSPAGPDLAAISVTYTSTVNAGQTVFVNATIRNVGSDPSPATDATLLVNGTVVRTTTLPALSPGANATVLFTWNTTTPGTYNLTVFADASQSVNETREDNNRISFTVTVKGATVLPDLELTLQPLPFPVYQNRTVTVGAWVRNAGNASAPVVVHFFVDGNLFARVNGSTLGPQDSVLVQANWTAGTPGNHTITAVVDREGVVAETREDNNAANRTVFVYPNPVLDLGVDITGVKRVPLETDFGSPGTNPIARRTILVDVTHHWGSQPASGTLTLEARGDLVGVATTSRIATVDFAGLAPGATRSFEIGWDVIGMAGDVEIIARVYAAGQDAAPANNVDVHHDYVLVGGLGEGVVLP